MAAIYKVGKKWRADWTDNDGVRHRQRFNTKGEADTHLDSIKGKLRAGTYVAPQKVWLFGALADSWFESRIEASRTPGAGYRPSSLAQWQSHIAHMKFCFENVKVSAIDAQAIEGAMAVWRLPKEQGGHGLSPRTIAKVRTTMSRIFRFGIKNRRGNEFDPTKLIETVKETSGEQSETGEALYTGLHEVSEKEVLTPQEAKQVVLAAKPGLYRTIIQTAIFTGARISELLALRWADVKFDHGTIDFRRTVSTARVKGEASQEKHRWFDPKTKKGIREIPIPAELVTALREWKEKCPKSRLELVFCNEFGEPCDRTGIGRYGLTPALKQAEIEKAVTMHGLRHTYASMLILLRRPTHPRTAAPARHRTLILRKYNARVWIVLAAALVAAADVTDRQTQTIPLPPGKTLSIEVTIGTVRIDGWDRPDVEIVVERRAPAPAQLARVPLVIEDLPAKVSVRALQSDNTTDPALRADVTVRVPRTAVIDRVQVLEGRIAIEGFNGTLTADIRRGPIDGKALSGTLRLESGIGSVTITEARLSANGLLRLRAFNGDVRLSLAERPVDARIMALAVNGHVKSDIPLTRRDTWGPRWGETTLGKGEPVISLDVVTGVVEIKSP